MSAVSRTILVFACLCLWAAGPAMAQTDVDIKLGQFGVGSAYRPGDFVGIRLTLTSNLDEPATSVWVQIEVPNADGDIGEWGRSITINRQTPKDVWLYAMLPVKVDPGSPWTVRVFEERDGRRRGELGGARVAAPQGGLVEISDSVIGIISKGSSRLGLDDYAVVNPRRMLPVASHEPQRIASGIKPLELPDRWAGLKMFQALVWSDADPTELRGETTAALIEYVRRGGHLIISLPEAGNPWGLGDPGRIELELEALLPAVQPRRVDGVPISTLLPVLSKSRTLDTVHDEFDVSIHVFSELYGDLDTIEDGPYEPLIALPDGRVLVVQRLFGFGRITICGINLADGQMNSVPLANGSRGMPQADAFWNRIIGRRVDTPTIKEISDLDGDELLADDNVPTENNLGAGRLFSEQIGMTRQAGIGLFLAFILFVAYWFVAGPGGYFVLRQLRQQHHAWLAFAAASGVFTALAWGIVAVMPQDEVTVRHVTYLDHVCRLPDDRRPDDPQYQRATSWFTVYLPDYRDTVVAIDPETAAGKYDLLSPWWPPGVNVQTFPNVDRFLVDVARSPGAFALPGRSTTTQLKADWLGSADRDTFGSFLWVDPEDPIRVVRDASGREELVRGTITHQLPGTLTGVTIIWIRNQRLPNRLYEQSGESEAPNVQLTRSGGMLNLGHAWAQPFWDPGRGLDLSTNDPRGNRLEDLTRKYFETYVDTRNLPGATGSLGLVDRDNYMAMLSIFDQLSPPEYLKGRPDDQEPPSVRFYREIGRELDLSPWFTRPCLIIIGTLEGSPTPVPLRIDGEPPVSEGKTVVRWIYPLPLETEIAFPKDEDVE